MASFPAGDASAIRQDADSLTTLSADTEELSAELRSAIRRVTSSWSGKAADGFERHASPRLPALGQLSDDLRSAGWSARAYGDRLKRAQQNYEDAISFGHSRGLRMATQTLVDPRSLLPPEPAKAVAAVEVERQIAKAVIAAQVAAVEFEAEVDGNEVETVITINEYDGSVVSKEVIPLRAADGSSATPQVGGRAELKNAARMQAMEDELNSLPRGSSRGIREVGSEEELNAMHAR